MARVRLARLASPALLLLLATALGAPSGLGHRAESSGLAPAVDISPIGGVLTDIPANTTGLQATFTATNAATVVRSATFTCATTGTITCTNISVTSYTFDPSEAIDIVVTYSTGAAGTGTLSLTSLTNGIWYRTGDYTISTTAPSPPPAPTVVLRNANDDNLDRSLCLTSGAGEAAAWQCGDLTVVHSTPSYATMGRERALTLVYNSAIAFQHPIAAVAVTQPGTGTAPTSVFAELKVNQGSGFVTVASATYGAWTSGTRQIALAWDASSAINGWYSYTLEVRNQASSGSNGSSVSGHFLVVRDGAIASQGLGIGWGIAGVERIMGLADNSMLWLGGDGSVKRYALVDGYSWGRWAAPAGAYRDTLAWDGTNYVRTLRHGIQVKFDNHGQHVETVNRTGQRTRFFWGASTYLLDSIRVTPVSVLGTRYRFGYSGSFLDYIEDPAGRITDVTTASGRITSIVDPDTSLATSFSYDGYGRMTSRTNRRGHATTYTYGNGLHVTRTVVPGTLATGDTTLYQPWDEAGLATGSTGQVAVDTANAYTTILGPRVGVADNASFWVNRWGAPVKMQSALGQVTTFERTNGSLPALVTKLVQPDGRIGLMSYDARGNLVESRDSTPPAMTNPVATAVSKWFYNSPNTKDSPDSIVDPEGVTTKYRYNIWGLDSLVIAANGHVTRFEYKPAGSADSLYGLVRAVTELSVAVWDSATSSKTTAASLVTKFGFNTLGNVVADTTPLGRVRSYTRDTRQLVTTAYDPGGYRTDFTYDNVNRLTRKILHGELAGSPSGMFPADSGVTKPDTTCWTYTVDMVTQVRDPRGMTRSYGYDRIGRMITQTDDYGAVDTTWYSAAGQVDSTRGRTGHKVRNLYDAGGRVSKTRWETRQQQADSVGYTYDGSNNRLLTAQRFYLPRKTTRTYFANGLLKTENDSGAGLFRNAYSYDRSGKRLTYVIGAPASTTANDSIAYRYNSTTGDLARIYVRWRHPAGNTDPITQDSVRLAWDQLGRRDTVAFTNGLLVRLAYDADGQTRVVCGVQSIGSPPVDYVNHTAMWNQWVDARGMVRQTDFVVPGSMCGPAPFQGSKWTQTYDLAGQMRSQTNGSSGWKFRYDRSGNMIRREANNGTDSNVFTIDPGHNRLTRHDRNGSVWSVIAYDADGSRAQECPNVPTPQCSVSPGYREYHYDGLGRTAGTWDYSCTSFNQNNLSCGIAGAGDLRVCGYDAVGRMDFPCEAGASALGLDGDKVTRTQDDASQFAWTFVHGPGSDDPLLGYTPSASSQAYAFFITDGAGRQLAVADRNGVSLLAGGAGPSPRQNYFQTGGGRYSGAAATATTFGADRFNSQAHSGLTSFRNRFYDQSTGRWTQEDPIGLAGGVNLYQFNGNNPVTYTDPFGLCKEKDEACKKRESVEKTDGTTDPGLLDPTAFAGGLAGAGYKILAKGAAAVGEKVLFEGGKSALKDALATGIEGVNSGQAAAIGQALKEGSVDAIKVVTGENGLVTYSTRAGRNGYQTLVRMYDGAGGLKGMAQAAWDAAGKFAHGEVWK